MSSYPLIQKKLLKVEIESYTTQLLLLGNSVFSAATVVFFFLHRGGMFAKIGFNLQNFIITVGFITMLTGILSVICRAVSIFHLDKIRKQIREREERILRLGGDKIVKKQPESKLMRAGFFMQSWVQTLLFMGTICLSLLSIISTMSLLLYGAGHPRTLTVFGVTLNPIIEWVGNIIFTIATYMSLGSFAILNRKTDFSIKKNRENLNRVLLLLLCNSLILVGICIGYLEKKNILHPMPIYGNFVLHMGSLLITTSIVLFAVFSYGILGIVENRCNDIYKKIQKSQPIESCLGYDIVLSQNLFDKEFSQNDVAIYW
ncbi:hypothetical protein [Candidatus Anaplasma sp. TIGMIC]|uniref:hypothetical protein n=1 Tax=Candidatus Anaplasma sp. TIGMIC TaxID=3020713 RepID=UPI00232F5A2B|nr:hypothetical protein [Candidatus Anaplasma sp. TIGMIC]MDB1135659.1 hypothetical protein [Candidatus Anaplasma sp. TIGMIC]